MTINKIQRDLLNIRLGIRYTGAFQIGYTVYESVSVRAVRSIFLETQI